MEKDTGYTKEEISRLTDYPVGIVESLIMEMYQKGEIKIRTLGKNTFYAVRDIER